MTVHEIENLPYADLKSRRDELVKAAEALPIKEVAARYVQARTDAKQRDEKLAEQAKTLDALREGMESLKREDLARIQRLGERTAQLGAVQDELKLVQNAAVEQKRVLDEQIKTLKARRVAETARANRLKTEALANHEAITTAAKVLNDAQARQAVEKADEGE